MANPFSKFATTDDEEDKRRRQLRSAPASPFGKSIVPDQGSDAAEEQAAVPTSPFSSIDDSGQDVQQRISSERSQLVERSMQEKELRAKRRDVLKQMMINGELPPVPKIADMILDGKVSYEEVKAQYADYKKKYPSNIIDTKGGINTPEALSQAAEANKDDPGFIDRVSKNIGDAFNRQTYIAGKYIGGLTMGLYTPEAAQGEAPDTTSAVLGGLMQLGGMLGSGLLAGAIVRGVPFTAQVAKEAFKGGGFLGKAIVGLEESAKASTGIARTAKMAAAAALEQAPLGAVVETARSTLEGNDTVEAIQDGIVGALLYGGGGAGLSVAFEGVGKMIPGVTKLFGASKTERYAAAQKAASDAIEQAGLFGKEGEAVAEQAASAAKKIPSTPSEILKDLSERSIAGETLTPLENKTLSAASGVAAMQPMVGPEMDVLLSKLPEMNKVKLISMAKDMVNKTFVEEGAPLAQMANDDLTVKTLLASAEKNPQNYIKLMQMIQPTFTNGIRKMNTYGDAIMSPFVTDSADVHEFFASKIMAKPGSEKFSQLKSSLITDYTMDPTNVAKREALMEAVPSAKERTALFGRKFFSEKGPLDMRMSRADQDAFSVRQMEKHWKTLSNGGKIALQDAAAVADLDAILSAAITRNKDMSSTLIGAARDGFGKWSENFRNLNPEFQKHIRSELKSRAYTMEMNDLIGKRVSLVEQMKDLANKSKMAMDDAAKKEFETELKAAREQSSNIVNKMSTIAREVKDSKQALNLLAPEDQLMIKEFANNAYLPPKKHMGIQSLSKLFEKFGFKDNPVYIADTSELADYFNLLAVSGKDLPERSWMFGLGSIVNIESPIRFANKHFGPGNPVSGLLEHIKNREAMSIVMKDFYNGKIDEVMNSPGMVKIKEGSKLDHILRGVGEGDIQLTDARFTSLKPEEQRTILSLRDTLNQTYGELFDLHNELAQKYGLPTINKRANYFGPALKDYTESIGEIYNKFLNQLSGDPEKAAIEGLSFANVKTLNLRQYRLDPDPSKVFFGFELPRDPNGTGELIGALEAHRKYVPAMMKRLTTIDLVREADVARSFAPEGLGKFIDEIKERYILGLPSELQRDLSKSRWNTAFQLGQKAMVRGELMFKANTAIQQLTSTALNFAIGAREAFAAIPMMFTEEGKRLWGMSTNRIMRDVTEQADMSVKLFKSEKLASLNKLPYAEKIKVGFDYAEKFGMWGLKTFDNYAAQLTFLTGHIKATKAGLNTAQAAQYADHWVDILQGSMANIARPEYARSTLGRALFQFQSFTTNLAATILNDIPNMAYHEGSKVAIGAIMRTVAGASIVNEIFLDSGLPPPFDLKMFLPFHSTYRFGSPGVFQAISNVYDVANRDSTSGRAAERLARFGLGAIVPGAGQAINIVKGAAAIEKGDFKGQEAKAMLFGPGALRYAAKQKAEAEGEDTFRKRVRKGLFGR